MNIDFKITTWESVKIPENREKEVFDKIKEGLISNANDIFNEFPDETCMECDYISDVDEQLSVKENGGEATIEVMENHEVIWDNKPK